MFNFVVKSDRLVIKAQNLQNAKILEPLKDNVYVSRFIRLTLTYMFLFYKSHIRNSAVSAKAADKYVSIKFTGL